MCGPGGAAHLHSPVVRPNEFRLTNHVLLGRFPNVGNGHVWCARKLFDIQRRELEVIMMGSMTLRGSRSAVAGLAEIVHALAEFFGFWTVPDSLRQQRSFAHDVVETPMPERTGWRIGVLDHQGETFGARGWIRPFKRRREVFAVG